MRGHRSGKIIFPGWKLYRFALECLIKDRILSLAGFVLPTMNRRDLAINGNREFLLGLARRCFVAWQCMMYSLWIYRRKRTHTNLYAYIDVSCTHTYTHTHIDTHTYVIYVTSSRTGGKKANTEVLKGVHLR